MVLLYADNTTFAELHQHAVIRFCFRKLFAEFSPTQLSIVTILLARSGSGGNGVRLAHVASLLLMKQAYAAGKATPFSDVR